MRVEGIYELYEKFPNTFLYTKRPELVPPRIIITRINGQPFSYYVGTDSRSGLNEPGDRAVVPALILGAGDRALISDGKDLDFSTFMDNSVEVMVAR